MAAPQRFHDQLRIVVRYRPSTGQVQVDDQWFNSEGETSLNLVVQHDITRAGREAVYRALRDTVGQYFDIMDARPPETPF